jgi:hypothetical protein
MRRYSSVLYGEICEAALDLIGLLRRSGSALGYEPWRSNPGARMRAGLIFQC